MALTERQVKLVIGGLLHDIGKVVYRAGQDPRNHSLSGSMFIENELGISDADILNCVKYHHGKFLSGAPVSPDDLCYLVYFADNVAAAADRRGRDDNSAEAVFDRSVPLESVFNILNRNHEKKHYRQDLLSLERINYPTDENIVLDSGFYHRITQNLKDNLQGLSCEECDIASVLSLLEANLSYVPSSTNTNELVDIPLYDHLKLTAGFASCLEAYAAEQGITDYKTRFFANAEKSYAEKMFLLFSMDISGIQSFIYTTAVNRVLKQLRARSVYLEILMEHLIDELLDKMELTRANLIYSGGGHCYMLLPNTVKTKEAIADFEKQVNAWFMKNFDIALYVGIGYAECCSNDLKNATPGSYSEIFRSVSRMISAKKLHRYGAEELLALNSKKHHGERECGVCKATAQLNDDGRCPVCAALERFATDVMKYNIFIVTAGRSGDFALPLPFGRYLTARTENAARTAMEKNPDYVRAYVKNNLHMGKNVAQNLWIGDYHYRDDFEELAELAIGNKKIAVLRADVDDLGNTFVNGFKRDNSSRYETLTRSAVLSRQLSLFFKGFINTILSNPPERSINGDASAQAAVTIVYSGGDDVFLVGAWNSVFDSFITIRNALKRFSQGTLNISGGIGIYQHSFPINVMASEVARLEDCSKNQEDKNAITFFSADNSYPWDVFIGEVLDKKLAAIRNFLSICDERGNSFMYNILDLLRNTHEKINLARLAYLLSRLEPDEKTQGKDALIQYREFSEKVYKWAQSDREQQEFINARQKFFGARQEFISALLIYVYLTRNEEI